MPRLPFLLFVALVSPFVAVLPGGVADEPAVPCSDNSLPTAGCPDLLVNPADMRDWDLVTRTFSASHCDVVEGHTQTGTRQLLRFSFATPNLGQGDLIIGRPADHPDWFEWSPCHGHYHFREYGDYRLWTPDGYAIWQAIRATGPERPASEHFAEHPELLDHFVSGNKQGFCVIDLQPVVPGLPSRYRSCNSNQGISVGWADVYVKSLSGQYIDVTGVPSGSYMLEAEVNSEHLYQETLYSNNAAAIAVQVP